MGRPDFRIRRGNDSLFRSREGETFRHDIAGGWRQREGMFMGDAVPPSRFWSGSGSDDIH